MSGKAIIVIDVQNCFLPGGSLATSNSRNSTLPPSTLSTSIAQFINTTDPEHLFISQDWHTPGHSSFVSNTNKAAGKTNYPTAAGRGTFANGIASGRYSGRNYTSRFWGANGERLNQKLWPEHCVQGTPGADVASDFTLALSDANKNKAITILKGDTPDIDSYSVIADALGNFTPHDENNRSFLSILKESNISEIYLTGIARDVCVFWSTMDLLNFLILPAYKEGKIIKLIFMYDLTRPVSHIPGAPYTDITQDQIKTHVENLIMAMGLDTNILPEVFEIRSGGYTRGGSRRTKRSKKNCPKRHKHTKKCKR